MPPRKLLPTLAYALMVAGALAAFVLIRSVGASLVAPAPLAPVDASPGAVHADALPHVLLALVVVIVAARAAGSAFKRLQQPPVVGEVIAGILLGPSLLGRLSPAASDFLLPSFAAPFLAIIAQVGVLLFMFLVGMQLDTSKLKKQTGPAVVISHASIVLPFLAGSTLSLWLYPRLSTSDVPFTTFALFVGISLSVTAFPVLARILTDRGIQKTKLGILALTCAAADDVTAWCLLALVVSIVKDRASDAALTLGLTLAYVAFMLAVARPIVARAARAQDLRKSVSQNAIAVTLVGLLLSALATEAIGIHAIFGAFLLGAIIPHESLLARDLTHKVEDLVVVLLLPAFFAFTGMRTQIALVHGGAQWLTCGLIFAVACLGKFSGTFAAARATGLDNRAAASLGVLMNTRGLMELIVLNIGLDLHVLSPTLFAMLVIMAVVTTFATTPILHLLSRGEVAPDANPAHR